MSHSASTSLLSLPIATTSAVLSVALFVACGGTTGASVTGADVDGGHLDDASGVAADAGSTTDPLKSDASDAATKADGAAPPADMRLDPLEVGRAWTYNVTVLGFYPSCDNGLGVATTLSKSTKQGKTAFQVQSLCKNAGTFEYAVENDRVFYFYGGAWHMATDEPVQNGHEWNDGIYDYYWEDEGTVTVAAGTFDHCFTAHRKLSYASFTTFCRGVGPVHWHFEDGLGNGYDAILASKNF